MIKLNFKFHQFLIFYLLNSKYFLFIHFHFIKMIILINFKNKFIQKNNRLNLILFHLIINLLKKLFKNIFIYKQ